ncbi:hypothetical protein HY009_09535 [Candidatus Acetothermia bacterium]|nr:hypothetical protein [Candidatus Acetothermia bacterium]
MLRRFAAGLVATVWLFVSFGPLGPGGAAQAQQTQAPAQPELVFPGDAKFSELENKLREKTQISGAAWVEEFKKHQVFGQVRSSNGLQGTLFVDSLAAINVLTGQAPFIVYGTTTIPPGSKLGQKDFSGNYGIVIFTFNGLVLALIDVNTGSTGAYVILPVEGQTIIVAPLFFPLFSPVGVFQVLFTLITVPAPTPQAPVSPQIPQLPSPTCPAELTSKSDLNVPLNNQVTIASIKDDSGNPLFEIGGAPPGILTVQAFGDSSFLQFEYAIAVQRRNGIIIGPGTARILLSPEVPFALLVTSATKTACVQATPKVVNGVITIVGTLATK